MNTSKSLTRIGQLAFALCLGIFSSAVLHAQSTPATGTPTQGSTATQPPTQGWMWWDDANFEAMKMEADKRTELRAIDDRYRADYDKMGKTPWTDAGYKSLTDRRNADIKGVLTPEQYQQWISRSSGMVIKPGTTTPSTTPKK